MDATEENGMLRHQVKSLVNTIETLTSENQKLRNTIKELEKTVDTSIEIPNTRNYAIPVAMRNAKGEKVILIVGGHTAPK